MKMLRNGASRRALIAALHQQIRQLSEPVAGGRLALGCAEIDAALKGGLAVGSLHEVAAADYRASPAAWGFLLALARIAIAARGGTIVWPVEKRANAFGTPYGSGLKAFGLDPARVLFIRCNARDDVLWAMEEALRIGGIGAVVGARVPRMNLTASRRLQLAAETSATPVFLLRSHKDDVSSVAATRWRVAPQRAALDRFGFLSFPRWYVALERIRGGRTGDWVVEWNHDAVCLRLPALLGGGVLPAENARSAA